MQVNINQHTRLLFLVWLYGALMLASLPGRSAQQILVAGENAELTASISSSQPNRISVLGDRIKQVIHRSGLFSVQEDNEKGDIYLTPQVVSHQQILNLFVVTESGKTYLLTLSPQAMSSQNILIKPNNISIDTSQYATPMSYPKNVMNLIQASWQGQTLKGYQLELGEHECPFNHSNLQVQCSQRLVGHELVAYKVTLLNKQEQGIKMHPRVLWQDSVVAVSFDERHLAPKQQTDWVIVVRN